MPTVWLIIGIGFIAFALWLVLFGWVLKLSGRVRDAEKSMEKRMTEVERKVDDIPNVVAQALRSPAVIDSFSVGVVRKVGEAMVKMKIENGLRDLGHIMMRID